MPLRPADFGNRIHRRPVARLGRECVCLFGCLAGTPVPKNGRRNIPPARGRPERWESPKLVLLLLGVFLLLFQSTAPAKVKEVRRVLLINEIGGISSPAFAVIDQAVFTG